VAVSGILANDNDPNSDPLTVLLDIGSGPKHGTLTVHDAGASLLYTPDADFYGTDSFTYRASDGQAVSDTATVSLVVTPVNDPPSFHKGPDLRVTDESGPQTFAGWATHISAGPANEMSQSVHFVLATDKLNLFAAPPVIDATGNLTFAPMPNTSGAANVVLALIDDGGTDNGGIDYSQPESFTITVDKLHPF